jgi:hypothetical protein
MPVTSSPIAGLGAGLVMIASQPRRRPLPNVKISGSHTSLLLRQPEDYAISNEVFVRRARIEAKAGSRPVSYFIGPPSAAAPTSPPARRVYRPEPAKPGQKTAFILRTGQEGRSAVMSCSSNNLLDRAGRRRRLVDHRATICSKSGFLTRVGASARVESKLEGGRMLSFVAGVYTGSGESTKDKTSAKSYGFRASAMW